jgi:hypothetical protein
MLSDGLTVPRHLFRHGPATVGRDFAGFCQRCRTYSSLFSAGITARTIQLS